MEKDLYKTDFHTEPDNELVLEDDCAREEADRRLLSFLRNQHKRTEVEMRYQIFESYLPKKKDGLKVLHYIIKQSVRPDNGLDSHSVRYALPLVVDGILSYSRRVLALGNRADPDCFNALYDVLHIRGQELRVADDIKAHVKAEKDVHRRIEALRLIGEAYTLRSNYRRACAEVAKMLETESTNLGLTKIERVRTLMYAGNTAFRTNLEKEYITKFLKAAKTLNNKTLQKQMIEEANILATKSMHEEGLLFSAVDQPEPLGRGMGSGLFWKKRRRRELNR